MKRTRHRHENVPAGYICSDSPLCYALEMEFDPTSIELGTIDLFDPAATEEDEVWKKIPQPWNDNAEQAALKSLRRAAQGGEFHLDCQEDGCECRLSPQWGPWGPWKRIPITGRFSIPAPTPPPPRLRYRANGTARARGRWKVGVCYRIEV